VLYELLTGCRPFPQKELAELRRAIIQETPSRPLAIRPGLPQHLDSICCKALAKKPEDRFQSAAELAQELELWQNERPGKACPTPWPEQLLLWRRRNRAVAMISSVSLVLLVAAGALIAGLQVRAADDRTRKAQAESKVALAEANRIMELRTKAQAQSDSLLRLAASRLLQPTMGRRAEVREILLKTGDLRPDLPAGAVAEELTLRTREIFARSQLVLDARERGQASRLPGRVNIPWPAAIRSNGKSMVIGAPRRPIVWQVDQPLQLPEGLDAAQPRARVWCSPDGKFIAYAPQDGGLEIWDDSAARVLAELEPRTAPPVLAIGFDRTQNNLLACRADGRVRSWSIPNFKAGDTRLVDENSLLEAAFSSGADELVMANSQHHVRTITMAKSKSRDLFRSKVPISAINWSPNSDLLAVGKSDGTIELRRADGELVHHFTCYMVGVATVLFDPSGRWLMAGDRHSGTKIWDAVTGELLLEMSRTAWGISADGRHLAATEYASAAFYDLLAPGSVRELHGHRGNIEQIAWCRNGRHLISSDTGFNVRVWDAALGTLSLAFQEEFHSRLWANIGIALSEDGKLAASTSLTSVTVREVNGGKIVAEWKDLPPALGNRLAALGNDRFRLVREEVGKRQGVVYDLQVGKPLPQPRIIRPAVVGESAFSTSFLSPDGKRYCWSGPGEPSANRRIEVRDVATGNLLRKVIHPEHYPVDFDGHLNAGGRLLVYWPDSNQPEQTNVDDLSGNNPPRRVSGRVEDVSRDLTWLAFQSKLGIPAFTLQPGFESKPWVRFTSGGEKGPALECFSPDSRRLAWASRDGTLTIVDLLVLQKEIADLEKELESKANN
jgi:WD40 repeat protein